MRDVVDVLVIVVNHHHFKRSDKDGKGELSGRLSPRALCACNMVKSKYFH